MSNFLKKAQSQLSRGNKKDAIALFLKILKLAPDNLDAHYLLGTTYAEMGSFAPAEKHLLEALKIQPDSPMVLNNLAGVYRLTSRYPQAIEMYQQAIAIDPYLVEAFSNLGLLCKETKQYDLAIQYYQRAAVFLPDSIDVLHGLATLYRESGDFLVAEDYFRRVLALKPHHAEARYLLDAMTGANPEHPPEQYVADLFDGYADKFEKHLIEGLECRIPDLLVGAITPLCEEKQRFPRAVDLGCGTGLVGPRIRPLVDFMVGVDLSEEMLTHAKAKAAYDELDCGNIVDFLSGQHKFDLFIAADVIIYIGNLDPLFAAIRASANPGALIAISTEVLEWEGDYALLPTGRYAHSDAYLRTLAIKHGFVIESLQRHDLRKEVNNWISGSICCLRTASS